MWFCFRWLSRQYVWSLLSCNVLWRPELREPLNKDILLLQNSLCHLFSLSVKLAVQCQMVMQCRPYCCVVQLWLAGWAMGRWGLRGHEVHTPKKTQSLLQNLSKSQGVRDHGVTNGCGICDLLFKSSAGFSLLYAHQKRLRKSLRGVVTLPIWGLLFRITKAATLEISLLDNLLCLHKMWYRKKICGWLK